MEGGGETVKYFASGDLVKSEGGGAKIVKGHTYGWKHVPDGWPIDQDGVAMNPKFLTLYTGAISAIPNWPTPNELEGE